MEKAIFCKKHPKFFIQWLRFLKENVEFGCIKCQDEAKDPKHILYLPEIIENPNIIIPHLPINEQIINFYNNLNKFSEEELEKYYIPFENQLIRLKELLENLIQNGRENLKKFKEICKESRQQLHKELKIEEIAQLIKEFELQSNEDQSVQDQIQQKLVDIKQQIHEDLMREQSSKIKKILNEASQTIYKFNLNCNKQINEISPLIYQLTENLKEYFNKSFDAIYRSNTSFALFINPSQQNRNSHQDFNQNQALLLQPFPYCRSYILPQYYFDYILKQHSNRIYSIISVSNQQNNIMYSLQQIKKSQKEDVSGSFWKFNTSNQQSAKLSIFKSNNNGNPIFGYFKYSVIEFIFSFTHNEIYPKKQLPIKQQQNKQDQDMFPSFIVGNFDIQIYANMIDGQSNLGSEFLWDSQNDDIEKTEYLFGGAKPNLQICEIFYF